MSVKGPMGLNPNPTSDDNATQTRIAQIADAYSLLPAEVARLEMIVTAYEPDEHEKKLMDEVNDIMAARRLAAEAKPRFGSERLRKIIKRRQAIAHEEFWENGTEQ